MLEQSVAAQTLNLEPHGFLDYPYAKALAKEYFAAVSLHSCPFLHVLISHC